MQIIPMCKNRGPEEELNPGKGCDGVTNLDIGGQRADARVQERKMRMEMGQAGDTRLRSLGLDRDRAEEALRKCPLPRPLLFSHRLSAVSLDPAEALLCDPKAVEEKISIDPLRKDQTSLSQTPLICPQDLKYTPFQPLHSCQLLCAETINKCELISSC